VKQKHNKDRRVDWLTYKNVNDWTDQAKAYLVELGMLKNKPGWINGIWSEVSLFHDNDSCYFLNTDETQHKFLTARNKGDSTTISYANVLFPRLGECIVESLRHTTGCHTVNLAGEVLPPRYIFDSKAKEEDKFCVDLNIAVGLPEVHGVYGLYETTCYAPYFAVCRKGLMDTSLWSQFNETAILNCYPRCNKTIVRCPLTNKLLQGPVVIKTNAGPGYLAKEAASWEFRERMHDRGLIIMLDLPNGTSVTQDMDQGYTDFK